MKEIDNKETDDMSIRVLVNKKFDESELENENIIPKTIEGIPTDVDDQCGEIYPLKGRTDRWRPAPYGISTAHVDVTGGTRGTIMRINNEEFLTTLSNKHVIANSNEGEEGDSIIQPGDIDGGNEDTDTIETLYDKGPKIEVLHNSDCKLSNVICKCLNCISKFFNRKTRFDISTERNTNEIDAALGKPIDVDNMQPYVLGEKKSNGEYEKLYHKGSRTASVGEDVWGSGRTLGYVDSNNTGAYVKSVDATIQVRFPNGTAVFENQIHIKSDREFAVGGMSGTALVAEIDDKVIGLVFAGSQTGTNSYANRIEIVEDNLNAKVVDMRNLDGNNDNEEEEEEDEEESKGTNIKFKIRNGDRTIEAKTDAELIEDELSKTAGPPPTPPHVFHGNAYIDDDPVEKRTEIKAVKEDGSWEGTVKTGEDEDWDDNRYQIRVHTRSGIGQFDGHVNLYVDGIKATREEVYSGEITSLDLNVYSEDEEEEEEDEEEEIEETSVSLTIQSDDKKTTAKTDAEITEDDW